MQIETRFPLAPVVKIAKRLATCSLFPSIRKGNGIKFFYLFSLGMIIPAIAGHVAAEELHTVEAIRELPIAQTEQNIPVRLHGVVTFFDERLYSHFIQDNTAGIYLQFPTNMGPPALFPGQTVDLTGTCSPGEYAPVVVVDHLEVGGKGPLPPAKVVTYEQLASGVEDSQFVEIKGIVRSVRLLEDSEYYLIEIATGGGRLLVYAKELPVKNTDDLLDSTLMVRGVCSTLFNHKRQLFSIRLMVPRPEDLEIKIQASSNPFTMITSPMDSLLQFAPQETYGHRVKVAGSVIYYVPGEIMFLQEGEQGIEVLTKENGPLQLGDRVEALGWVSQGEYSPILEDAVFQKISSGQPEAPTVLTPGEVLKGNNDGRLIQVTARVLDYSQNSSEQYLILQTDGFIFHAYLKRSEGKDAFAGLANGSLVAVTGVCQIDPGEWQAGEAWRAKGFNIKLRSTADVVLLKSPSWWTLRKVLWMTGVLGFAALAAFGWVAVLHRQVAERTRQLEIQIQERQRADRRREIEQERSRVAQDLHDDLGAGLTEVEHVDLAREKCDDLEREKSVTLMICPKRARHMVTSFDEIVWAVNPL